MIRPAAGLLLAALVPCPALAQWTLDVGAGRAVHDPVAARVPVTSASAGVRYEGESGRWLYLSGGLPLGSEGPAWGAGGAGLWLPLAGAGSATLGLRGGFDAFGYGATDSARAGGGATAHAAPVLTLERGPLRAEAYAGALVAGETGAVREDLRPFLDAGARLGFAPLPGAEVAAEGRLLRGGGVAYPYAGVSASAERDRLSGWAFAGRWLTDSLASPRNAFGAGAGVRLGWGAELSVSYQQDPADPVWLNAPRRGWSVQLSRALGRAPRPAAPVPAPVVPLVEGGRITLWLPAASHAEAPSVIGDFTGWQPVAMTREGDRWTARLAVSPGSYHYGFRGADGAWFVPPGLPVVDDGMGGTSAVLVVP